MLNGINSARKKQILAAVLATMFSLSFLFVGLAEWFVGFTKIIPLQAEVFFNIAKGFTLAAIAYRLFLSLIHI